MTDSALLGVFYIAVVILGFGSSTAFLRVAIVRESTDLARFTRVGWQTAVVLLGVALVGATSTFGRALQPDAIYSVMNGFLSGLAFICFSKGLESTEASTAKPLLSVATVTTVLLGVVVLGEVLTPRKIGGIVLAIVAVYLPSTE
jgi:drug/metabolite transporter (DMT)-like permease